MKVGSCEGFCDDSSHSLHVHSHSYGMVGRDCAHRERGTLEENLLKLLNMER